MIKEFFKSIYKRGNRFINPHNKIPLTRNFGFYRGTPIDRYFINKWIYDFLDEIDSGNKLKGIEIGGFDYLKYNSKKYLANELVPKRELKKSKDSLCINLNEPINKDFKFKEKYDFVICTQVLHVLENDINGLKIIYDPFIVIKPLMLNLLKIGSFVNISSCKAILNIFKSILAYFSNVLLYKSSILK